MLAIRAASARETGTIRQKAAKIKQEEAAEKAHLNAKYLGEIERGEKRPSFEAILALAKALNTCPSAFFQFDREEGDEKALRKKVDSLVNKASPQQLQQVYRVLKALQNHKSEPRFSISLPCSGRELRLNHPAHETIPASLNLLLEQNGTNWGLTMALSY